MSPRRGWRRAKLVAGTLALTLASFGTVAAVNVPAGGGSHRLRQRHGCCVRTYTIGAPSGGVNNVTVTPTTATRWDIPELHGDLRPSVGALATGNTITIGDSSGSNMLVTAESTPSTVALISGSCLQAGTVPTTTVTSAGLTIALNSSACPSIAAGSTVTVPF